MLKEINLAQVLTAKRREKGVTQDELAGYIGVSKASVSKWETGVSYPDITLLPILASYFGISIDELMNYTPQLTKPKITEIYSRLAANFATEPFEDVISECESLVKKYYSCYAFLLQIVQLYLNHIPMAEGDGRKSELTQFAIGLCKHIINDCRESNITKTAASFQALCHIIANEPAKVFELLGEDVQPEASLPGGRLISQAYQMLGNTEKAKEIMQTEIFLYISLAFNGLANYIQLNTGDFAAAVTAFERAEKLSELFNMRRLSPNDVAAIYFFGANVYLSAGKNEQAIEMLEKYVDVCTNGFFPFAPRGDEFFDKINGWLAKNTGNKPRTDSLIKESMLGVMNAPTFDALRENPCFIELVNKMKKFIGGN